ncbi:disease resistance response protein 206-like [Cynara cardunculus var. scolymus]|uniref:disease resistance response protein 206-like n=1 Tax=Cynara cardunculus var. scolymus TaxID=59895 RepID=UPI000D62C3F8|nr:disease resistance response protein 206-like [Cynara cardunculus var. scolymus]
MGLHTTLSILVFFFMFLTLSSSDNHQRNNKHYKPCKHLLFFFHSIRYNGNNAANATSTIVAAPQWGNLTKLADQNHFGDVVVFDNPITLDNNLHSLPIGRAQGLYLYDNKKILTAWFAFSFILNTTDYHGNFHVIGVDSGTMKIRDLSIVGGTGDFFMHRGIASITTDAVEDEVYFRLRVDIKFYECW